MTKNIHNTRVALLIDTDNVPYKYASELFKGAAVYGSVIIRKGYGVLRPDTGNFWKKEIIFEHAIEPVVRYEYAAGKNITDFALVIDALDLAYRNIVDVICIASNDSDFSLVTMKLREVGVKVCGFGTHEAAKSFVNACDQFVRVGPKQEESQTLIKESSNLTNTASASEEKDIGKMVAEAYENCNNIGGWVQLATVGQYLRRIDPAFSVKDYGDYKILTELVESLGEYQIDSNSGRFGIIIRKKTQNS